MKIELNFLKKEMTLQKRELWNIALWGLIMENFVLLYYLFYIKQFALLFGDTIIMLFLFILMITNNKKGLELMKKQQKEKLD